MSAIRDGGKVKARERIAVLAALNLAFALAERPAGAAPRAAPTTAMPRRESTTSTSTALIRRIDMALGADGQLL